MSTPVSLCGLLACPRREWQSWPTAFYQLDLAEVDPEVAKEFVEQQVDHEGLAIGETDTDFLLCAMHYSHDVERAGRILIADQPVDPEEEYRIYGDAESTWTVCGMFRETGQCFSGLWVGNGPRSAYANAFCHYQATSGLYLAVACVHPGVVELAPESATYADPTCKTEDAMADRLRELIPA